MKTYEGRAGVDDGGHTIEGRLTINGDGLHVNGPESLLKDRGEDEVVLASFNVTKGELSTSLSKLEREDRLSDGILGNQGLEQGRSLELCDALEGHTHQAIGLEVLGVEAIGVLSGGTDRLLGGRETGNGDGVGEDFTRDGGAVTELGLEIIAGVRSVGGLGGIVGVVAGAGVVTVRAREEKIRATGIEVDYTEGNNEMNEKL
jgi:hypothetical protein